MPKFTTGLIAGAAVGTLVGLLTAKRTGAQTQQAAADYVSDLATSTQSVQKSVARLQAAGAALQTQLTETLAPNVAAINQATTDFAFKTQGNQAAIADHLAKIEAAMPESQV